MISTGLTWDDDLSSSDWAQRMGQKVNPTGFRLGGFRPWESTWYASKSDFADLLVEDFRIREYVQSALSGKRDRRPAIAKIAITRTRELVVVTIFSSRVGAMIGKRGERIEKLAKRLTKMTRRHVEVKTIEVARPEIDPTLVAEEIAEQLEKRGSFRRAMKMATQRAMEHGAKGVKLQLSGRLGGSEMARCEKAMEGCVPLSTLRAKVEYGFANARTPQGHIGIKVWINNGEYQPEEKKRPGPSVASRLRSGTPPPVVPIVAGLGKTFSVAEIVLVKPDESDTSWLIEQSGPQVHLPPFHPNLDSSVVADESASPGDRIAAIKRLVVTRDLDALRAVVVATGQSPASVDWSSALLRVAEDVPGTEVEFGEGFAGNIVRHIHYVLGKVGDEPEEPANSSLAAGFRAFALSASPVQADLLRSFIRFESPRLAQKACDAARILFSDDPTAELRVPAALTETISGYATKLAVVANCLTPVAFARFSAALTALLTLGQDIRPLLGQMPDTVDSWQIKHLSRRLLDLTREWPRDELPSGRRTNLSAALDYFANHSTMISVGM